MAKWPFAIALDGPGPVFVSLARAIADAIADGRLRPGDAIPGSRTLAATLGVHRNTVLAALRELTAEGWIASEPGRGTFVARDLPERPARAPRGLDRAEGLAISAAFPLRGLEPAAAALRHVPGSAAKPPRLQLVGGLPDLRLLPHGELARAYRRALRAGAARRLLGYGDPAGDESLRAALAAMLSQTRGIPAQAGDVLVTRGSQMALALFAQAVLAPGDRVAVEAYGYRPAWEALRLAGAELVPVPVDAEGIDVDALETIARAQPLRAVYVTPHHQYPTTALLSASRRLALLSLARRHGLAIVEDDYDHEFHYEGRPVLPLAAAREAAGHVVYVGTLSKVLAPGLRVGFLVGPRALRDRAVALRTFLDRQGDHAVERALAELLDEGVVQRHVRKMRNVYRARRDAFVEALGRHLPDLRFRLPPGGLAIWARAPRGTDVEAWASRAEARGVALHTARRFAFDGRPRSAFRLGFAPVDETEIEQAVRIAAKARTA